VTRPRGKPIKVWVTEEERAEIVRKAASANLSMSAYLRAAGLNHPVRSMMDIHTITELSKIHGELGRIVTEKHLKELQDLQTMIHQIMGSAIRGG
jgi:hypothetical protein